MTIENRQQLSVALKVAHAAAASVADGLEDKLFDAMNIAGVGVPCTRTTVGEALASVALAAELLAAGEWFDYDATTVMATTIQRNYGAGMSAFSADGPAYDRAQAVWCATAVIQRNPHKERPNADLSNIAEIVDDAERLAGSALFFALRAGADVATEISNLLGLSPNSWPIFVKLLDESDFDLFEIAQVAQMITATA